MTLDRGTSSGSVRVGGIVAAAFCACAAIAVRTWVLPASADPMPSSNGSPQPNFFATPYPSPADDIPTIYHAPLPIPTTAPPGGQPAPLPSGATPGPSATSIPLQQGNAVVTADEMYGSGGPHGDMTALGHVEIVYGTVDILADQAIYDGTSKIITATGHVKFINANGDTATAQSLDYDTNDSRVTMNQVQGQSAQVYSNGQQIQGYLYYKAQQVTTYPDGHTILHNGWITTCDLSHVAYHITGKEIEIRPGDRLIAHSSDLYLSKYLVAALGILVIPLSREAAAQHPSTLAPSVGYNSTLGFFMKSFINFYRNPYFYGTYHVDLFQKVGIGLGADLYFYRRDQRGQGTFTFYDLHSNQTEINLTGQRDAFQSNLNIQEPLGRHLTGSLQGSYTGQSSLLGSIPSQTSANLAISHDGLRTQTNYGANLSNSGGNQSLGLTVDHTIQFSEDLSQSINLATDNTSVTGSSFSHSVSLTTDTHFNGRALDGDLAVETSHGYSFTQTAVPTLKGTQYTSVTVPVLAFQKLPELTLDAHPFEIDQRVPVDFTLIAGVYDDPFESFGSSGTGVHVETSRFEAGLQLGDALLRVGGNSNLTAMATLRQDAYGTGDLRGLIGESYSFQTLYGNHADTTLSYDVNSVRGFSPLQSFDGEFPSNTYSEAFNFYNGSFYRFTASTDYDVTAHAQGPITYQLTAMPGRFSLLTLGDSFSPTGGGYGPMAIQLQTPLGKYDYFQMVSTYDFKLHGLQGQNYYLTHDVSNCYLVSVAYLQPLRQVTLSVSLLAFPGQGASFGFTGNGSSLLANSFGSAQ